MPQHRSDQDADTVLHPLSEHHKNAFEHWAAGYGVIQHDETTQQRVYELATMLQHQGRVQERDLVFRILAAADRIASAAMWLVVHMVYARRVHLDGRDLMAEDFKPNPEGHSGGALNMVPAYVGYLAANTITGNTRAWLMGQGHCVSAIDASNVIVNNMTPEHAERYALSNDGLTRLVQDFYSYKVRPDGRPDSPLGSHVNVHTAGGMMEGGYLGFAELQYAHMPQPGESLVTFLSDGAFEEQRGSDWAPRWWRTRDSGLVTPFMIANGRRIDQRSSMAMKGGADWFCEHLRRNGFDPIGIDGHDPAAYAWAIIAMEERLLHSAERINAGKQGYPAPLPYGVAECIKGYGFPGAGTNRAHNLPLEGNPHGDAAARRQFNQGAADLWVDLHELSGAVRMLNRHSSQSRPKERDHPLARPQVDTPRLPEPPWRNGSDEAEGAMFGIDSYFCDIVKANPQLRVRVGNPDEMESNRLSGTLALLRHRVTHPEPGIAEAVDGRVITALNEEAVVSAALANKAGLNLVASYEAFMVKMLGAVRQELIFARQQCETEVPPGWISLPLIATSHTWENGKNEQSHQDPTFSEVMMGEMNDVSRVLFPADWNSAVAALEACYASHGQFWTLVVPKRPLPQWFDSDQARRLIRDGAVRLRGNGGPNERLLLAATGAYQLRQVLRASDRLQQNGIEHSVIYIQEPGRFRIPRDRREMARMTPQDVVRDLFPASAEVRVFLTHTRPEPYIGTLWPLLVNTAGTPVLGYVNQGGTLDEDGMLFANRCTWAHAIASAATGLGELPEVLLSKAEFAALAGQADPDILFNKAGRDND